MNKEILKKNFEAGGFTVTFFDTKEAAADLRKEKMRAERDYCNRESEKRLRSEKEKNMGCVCIHIIIVEL